MAQFILYIAQSLDGYIADIQGSTHWLHELPNPEQSDYGFHNFMESVGVVVMGRKTYDSILGFNIPWPYPQQESYILSRKELEDLPDNCHQIKELNFASLQKMKAKLEKDIWLVGGAQIVKHALEQNLLDKLIIFTMPVTLGAGIRLFPEGNYAQNWKLSHCEVYSSGVLQHEYLPNT